MREIPNTNKITTFLHCAKCINELQEKAQKKEIIASPKMYARYEVGYTPIGIQVWCLRHNCNILHMDLEGQKHPANVSAKQ